MIHGLPVVKKSRRFKRRELRQEAAEVYDHVD
jgi:hypothetical protein